MRTLRIVPATLAVLALAACTVSDVTNNGSSEPFFTLTSANGVPDSLTLPVGSVIDMRILVTHAGVHASTVGVLWTAKGGNSRVADTVARTDTLGYTTAHWVLSEKVGSDTLTVTTADGSHTFYARAIPGTPSSILRATSDSLSVAAGSPATLAVNIVDGYGNAVPNAAVNWSTSGGSLSATTSRSNDSGRAETSLTAPSPGVYTVAAQLPERATVMFLVVAN